MTTSSNPFSESNFKTAKYRPDYPDRFDDLDHARTWFAKLVGWYNEIQYHTTPAWDSIIPSLSHP